MPKDRTGIEVWFGTISDPGGVAVLDSSSACQMEWSDGPTGCPEDLA